MKHPKPPVIPEPAPLLCKDGTTRHYWRIAPPDGPTSWGKCRWCKERRLFPNYLAWQPELQEDGHTKMYGMSLKW